MSLTSCTFIIFKNFLHDLQSAVKSRFLQNRDRPEINKQFLWVVAGLTRKLGTFRV